MSTHYCQLTQAQRYQIWSLYDTGHKQRFIAEVVSIHFSTVSRELKRNRSAGGYDPELAHCQSITRQRDAKKSLHIS